jgi:hypothetical protein
VATRPPEQIRQAWLDGEIGQWFEDRDPRHGSHSEYRRALDAISLAALKHAEATNAPPSGGEGSFESLLEHGFSVVQNLRWAVQPFEQPENEKKKLKLWSHRIQPLYEVKSEKTPDLNRPQIESAVGQYLALPYRAEHIDRLFADVLIALEFYQFSDEMINEQVIVVPVSPLKQAHPLVDYLRYAFTGFLIWAIFGGVVFVLHWFGVLSDGWAWGGYITCAVLYLLGLALMTAFLPFVWREQAKNVKWVKSLIAEMLRCYSALASDGPVSARHLLEQLRVAADKGVVWPAPLYALLDDVMTRTGRL